MIYEVNIEVDPQIADDYYSWLQKHVDKTLQYPGFEDAEIYRLYDVQADQKLSQDPVRFSVRYSVASTDSLEEYLAGPAQALRKKAFEKFGNRFKASRRVLKLDLAKK